MGSVQGDREGELREIGASIEQGIAHMAVAAIALAKMLDPQPSVPEPWIVFPYEDEIEAAVHDTGIDPIILAGLIQAESGFKPDKPGADGERGLVQIMPGAWSDVMEEPYSRAWEPALNILAGARYWMAQRRWLLKDPYNQIDTMWAFVAYNSGPGNTQDWLEEGKTLSQLSKTSRENQARYRAGMAWARAQ